MANNHVILPISPRRFYGRPTPRPRPSQQPPPIRLPQSTPIFKKVSGIHSFSSVTPPLVKERRSDMATETSGQFVGPMPVRAFMEEYMPGPPGEKVPTSFPKAKGKFVGAVKETTEPKMCAAFVTDMRSMGATKGYAFVNSSHLPDGNADGLHPDIGAYKTKKLFEQDKTDFRTMDFDIELKLHRNDDGFRDPAPGADPSKHRFEHDSQDSQQTRGQIALYCMMLHAAQFRVHSFSVLACGNMMRFLRWDSSAATVTEAFDYTKEPEVFAQFLWRMEHLTEEQKGYDVSVSEPTESEARRARDRLKLDSTTRMVKVMVPGRDDEKDEKPYIIPYPKARERSVFGRVTRSSTAYDVEHDRVVYLKESWRVVSEGLKKEGEIYRKLEEKGVENVARFDRGNDVRGYQTRNQDMVREEWACPTRQLECHRLYRMTLLDVGRDISSFHSSWELVNALAGAMRGHQMAYTKANILHRDISAGNVIILPDGTGLLIDWDLSVDLDERDSSPRRPGRTGTWQFISAALLKDPKKVHEAVDDRESCLHVLTWIALRYISHDRTPGQLSHHMRAFDEASYVDGHVQGGDLKQGLLFSRVIPKSVVFKDLSILNKLLMELTKAFAVRYEDEPTKAEVEEYKELKQFWPPHKPLPVFPPAKYFVALENVQSPTWLVDTLQKYLEDRSAWPTHDPSVRQKLAGSAPNASSKKRKSDEAKITSHHERQSKMFKSYHESILEESSESNLY